MSETVDTVILHNELAYADVLPVQFHPLAAAPDAAQLGGWADRTLRMLQASTALEDQGNHEKLDEEAVGGAHIQRIDLKVNLLLELVGHLLAASQSRPPAAPLRFNARGIVWTPAAPSSSLVAGSRGRIEIYLRECLVQPLTFTGTLVDADPNGPCHMKFDSLPEIIEDQVEKLVFRRHRRSVAGVRLTRRA